MPHVEFKLLESTHYLWLGTSNLFSSERFIHLLTGGNDQHFSSRCLAFLKFCAFHFIGIPISERTNFNMPVDCWYVKNPTFCFQLFSSFNKVMIDFIVGFWTKCFTCHDVSVSFGYHVIREYRLWGERPVSRSGEKHHNPENIVRWAHSIFGTTLAFLNSINMAVWEGRLDWDSAEEVNPLLLCIGHTLHVGGFKGHQTFYWSGLAVLLWCWKGHV